MVNYCFTFVFRVTLLLAFTQIIVSCSDHTRGNGNIMESQRTLSDFDEIEILGNYEVELHPSDKNFLVIETDENLHEIIESEIDGETLFIRSQNPLLSRQSVKVYVYFKNINKVSSTGSSVISCTNMLKTTDLSLNLTGTGSINMEIEAERLEIELPGAGLIKLVGYVNEQKIEMSGAGNLNAKDLVSNNTEIVINGVGNAEINVQKQLRAEVNGIGSIKYIGQPEDIKKEVRGLGSISRNTTNN